MHTSGDVELKSVILVGEFRGGQEAVQRKPLHSASCKGLRGYFDSTSTGVGFVQMRGVAWCAVQIDR